MTPVSGWVLWSGAVASVRRASTEIGALGIIGARVDGESVHPFLKSEIGPLTNAIGLLVACIS